MCIRYRGRLLGVFFLKRDFWRGTDSANADQLAQSIIHSETNFPHLKLPLAYQRTIVEANEHRENGVELVLDTMWEKAVSIKTVAMTL